MNKNNYIFYAIIIYIIIISILIITKPNFIYDHDKSKFREFGYTKDKTIFTIGVLSVFFAVLIVILFSLIGNSNNEEEMITIPKQQYINMMNNIYNQQLIPQIIQQQMPQIIQHQIPQIIQQPIPQIISQIHHVPIIRTTNEQSISQIIPTSQNITT
jgi:hypothetical protein